MNPLLALWASGSTVTLQALTGEAVRSIGSDARYSSARVADDASASTLASTLSVKYRELIQLTDSDTTLHCVAVLPLSDSGFPATLATVTEAIKSCTDRVSLHVLTLRRSLVGVLGHESSIPGDSGLSGAEVNSPENDSLALLDRMAGTENFTYTTIDNYVESGAPLDFSEAGLAEYIARLFTALMTDYYAVLPPSLLTGEEGHNITIGISNYHFDRDGACDMLLHRAFVSAMERVGIDETEVDTQKCLSVATAILSGINYRYKHFYDAEVEPLYKSGGLTDGNIAGRIGEPMRKEMEAIEAHVTSFLADTDLSFPEKECVLALILGSDNTKLRGVQYEQTTLLLDDVCTEPINAYINAFNDAPADRRGPILPIRSQYAGLRKMRTDPVTGEQIPTEEDAQAFNPLPAIKDLKREILDTTAFIRRKSEELTRLEEIDSQRKQVERQKNDFIAPRSSAREEIKEQPLDDIYTPSAGVKPMQSVDLRKYFSEVRDQKDVGSCSTFAVVSMYEAIVNRLQQRPENDRANLSEQFVYHFSNVVEGRPEGGSNYHDQLAVLGSHGVCEESLFGYTRSNFGEEPSAEAVADALNHRVLKALQVPLKTLDDKLESLHTNHALLTSALSEGYPVGIALKLYDSFGKTGAHISRPNDAELSSEAAENHAMVLVGYSEEQKCYIVRNSWGTAFGDNGYCYISSAYVDDPELNMFACIITETTEAATASGEPTPALLAPLAGRQTEIEIAAIRNILDESRFLLDHYQRRYDELYRYYSTLMQRLCMPQIRTAIRRIAEEECMERLDDIRKRKDDLENSFISILKGYKVQLLYRALIASGVALALCFIVGGIFFFSGLDLSSASWMSWLGVTGLAVLVAVFMWIDKASRQRRKRTELKEQMEALSIRENRIAGELLEMQLRFHVAGMWIDSFHTLRLSVEKTYNRLQSFIDSLHKWMEEDRDGAVTFAAPVGSTFIPATNRELLEAYCAANIDALVARIDLLEAFAGYVIDAETITQARERLSGVVHASVGGLFERFNMYDLICGNAEYPYIKSEEAVVLVDKLLTLGQPAARHTSLSSVQPARILMARLTDDAQARRWSSVLGPHFPTYVDTVRIADPDSVTLLTLRAVTGSSLR